MWSLQPGSTELDIVLIPGDPLTFLGPCLRLLAMPLRHPKGQLWAGSELSSQGGVQLRGSRN